MITWWAVRKAGAGQETELNGAIARFAWRWALWTTVAQVIDGFILLAVLPRHVLLGLVQGGLETLAPLGVSIILGIGLLMMLARTSNPVEKPALVGGTLSAMTLTIAIMSITRHQVRALYLGAVAVPETAPQWGNILLFVLLLIAGLATLAYTVRRVLASPATGEQAA